jgi:hypothetical protein
MKDKYLIFLLMFFSFGQTDIVRGMSGDSLLLQIPVQAIYFTTDQLSNIYYLNSKDEIIKHIFSDGRTFTYSNKQLGKPSWIDASNPMRVLVLYPDVQTVVILDSRLGQINLIRLLATADGHSYLPVAACAQPDADYIWIFDGLSQTLVKLDERGNTVAESEPFRNMFNFSITEAKMYYHDQTLFMADGAPGVLVFDRFGSFVQAMDITPSTLLQISKEHFIFMQDQQLQILSRNLYGRSTVPMPVSGVLQGRVVSGRFFVRTADAILVYQYAE